MEKIAVLGAGIMGAGIAQAAALAGYQVILRDLQMHLIKDGLNTIDRTLDKLLDRGLISEEDKLNALNNLKGTTDLSELKDVDLVIEAVVENMSVKKQIFAELDSMCGEKTILASNTSSLSISEIAATTGRTDRVLGMHFFNPVHHYSLVEIIKGLETSEATIEKARDFCNRIGKQSVLVKRESPGYIVNRILFSFINEAIFVYADGGAEKEAIDTAIKLGLGMELGPLEQADKIGLDHIYRSIIGFNDEFRDSKYRPHPLLSTMIRAGHLGVSSGKGFYVYECPSQTR
ncbi:MAG: 3-hydroxyacyl-CoA dehydrogenase family protein [Syntrophomonadaceae bacterium]|nr:3-hydroxybutyryl-CoA dehydrogenase [Syntrophomonadaceae bacterium]